MSLTSLLVLIGYYGFGLPFCYIFAFLVGSHYDSDTQQSIKGLGLNGLWFGMMVGQGVLAFSYQFFISCKTDWYKAAREAQQRTEKDEKLIQMKEHVKEEEIQS